MQVKSNVPFQSEHSTLGLDNFASAFSFGTCQWACKKPIFESACGSGTAGRIEIGYNLAFQTIPKLYLDLKVIDDIPEECKKYTVDVKDSTIVA